MTTEEKKKQLVNEKNHDFNSLRMLTEVLRGKGGCPWDMEQTHESIRNDIIEETYEVVEAIDNSDPKLLREELGDVLFQVMFHSRIEEEAGRFSPARKCRPQSAWCSCPEKKQVRCCRNLFPP